MGHLKIDNGDRKSMSGMRCRRMQSCTWSAPSMSFSTSMNRRAKASSPETLRSLCLSTSYLSYFLQIASTRVRISITLIFDYSPFSHLPLSLSPSSTLPPSLSLTLHRRFCKPQKGSKREELPGKDARRSSSPAYAGRRNWRHDQTKKSLRCWKLSLKLGPVSHFWT